MPRSLFRQHPDEAGQKYFAEIITMIYGLRLLSYGSLLSTYALMVIGSYVSASGSGGACGTDWPQCNGQLIPQLSDPHVLSEYTHRIFTLLVTAFVIAMVLTVWLRYKTNRTIVTLSTIGALLLFVQVLLGMVTVATKLEPVVVSAHLALASAIFGVVLVNTVEIRRMLMGEGPKLKSILTA